MEQCRADTNIEHVRVCYPSAGWPNAGPGAVPRTVGSSLVECVHDAQTMCEVNLEEILALLVAFWEAMRP